MARIHFVKDGDKPRTPGYNRIARKRKIWKAIRVLSGVLNVLLIGYIIYNNYLK